MSDHRPPPPDRLRLEHQITMRIWHVLGRPSRSPGRERLWKAWRELRVILRRQLREGRP